MMQQVSAIIIGGGPAGAATAISLYQQGVDCLVLETGEAASSKPGETIPPNARAVLQKLGLLEQVHHPAHATCVGNVVYWGTHDAQSRPFFAEPHGNGWHLDRAFFEQQLQSAASEKGVQWLNGWCCISVQFEKSVWHITCKNRDGRSQVLHAPFIVDATGRASRVARMLGITRQSFDRLTGYYVQVASQQQLPRASTFIESAANGWWYAAPLQNERTILNFMSDTDLHALTSDALSQWLFAQLQQTVQLKNHITIPDPAGLSPVHIKPASTSALQQVTGENWLAVGDAAFSYDPLSSYGITAALGGGIYAGLAIGSWLRGEKEALDAYRYLQEQAFEKCQVLLRQQYSLETRWPDSAFWKRRQG